MLTVNLAPRRLPFVAFLVVLLLLAPRPASTAQQQPNFLLVLLDDAGWTDVGCYGSSIETPQIDTLAREGMRFTDCHSAAPNCSPSRAGLLTGRTPSRAGIYSYLPTHHVMHLRDEEITVAELLKGAGYRTGHFGKWHLSRLRSDQPGPAEQGFDYSLGTDNNAHPSHRNPDNFVRNGEPVGALEGYSCQLVVDEALRWLNKPAEAPFFACVWFHEPHTPIASPGDLIHKYQQRYPELSKKQATYYANIENVDIAVGRLLKGLAQFGLAQDTVVFLTSDNGPLNRFSRAGLRGQKSNLWEGGHRVPGIFRWPGRIEPGTTSHVPVSGVDYLPTVCELAGVPLPEDRTLDGMSLCPLLLGEQRTLSRSRPLYWFFYRLNPALALREGRWSLVAESNDASRPKAHGLVREDIARIRASEPTSFQLFDLSQDLAQRTDLSAAHPEVAQRLFSQLRAQHRGVITEGHAWDIPRDYGAQSKRKVWNSE